MEINKETFTIQDLKQLLKEAFDFDYEKHKGKVKFLPLTVVEWYKSEVFKDKLSYCNIKGKILEWRKPFDCVGTYFKKRKTFAVFFKRTKIIKLLECYNMSLEELLVSFLITLFHELQHHYHVVLDELESVNLFSYQVCRLVKNYDLQSYREYHDEYWSEIDAELYGLERTYDFLKSKGMLNEKTKKILQKYKNQWLFNLNNFDIHIFLSDAHKIIKSNPEIDLYHYWPLWMFYNNNHGFRSINKILSAADYYNLDKEILNIFLSSVSFLKRLDFNTLSLENKQIIMNAIEYTLKVEINRRKKNKEFLQNKQITAKQYLDADAIICNKIAYYQKKLDSIRKIMNLSDVIENQEDLGNKRR